MRCFTTTVALSNFHSLIELVCLCSFFQTQIHTKFEFICFEYEIKNKKKRLPKPHCIDVHHIPSFVVRNV